MSPPSVLALVPAYNPDLVRLRTTLGSLLAQTTPIDICLIDDGSATPLGKTLSDLPGIIHLRFERNAGITRALHDGVRLGLERGYDYLCRLDVGDVSHPNRVARQLAHLQSHPDIDLLGALSVVRDLDGMRSGLHGVSGGPNWVRRYLWLNAAFKHSTFMLRASAIKHIGNYDLDFAMAQDYELALRMARKGKVDCLAEPLIDYIVDPRGLSIRHRERQLRMRLKAQRRHAELGEPLWYLGIAKTLAQIAVAGSIHQSLSLTRRRPAVTGRQA